MNWIFRFVKVGTWIFLCCHIDLSKFLHVFLYVVVGFVKVATWICLSFYMDLSKLLLGFVKIVTTICQRCSMYFSPFAKQHQDEIWPRFQSLLKLLFWANGVDCQLTQGQNIQCLGGVLPLAMSFSSMYILIVRRK